MDDLLWPRSEGPEDLLEVERTPLEERGLPASSYALLVRAAEMWPDHPAVSVMADAERWQTPLSYTYSELAREVHRVASAFAGLGVGRGEPVAFVTVNCAQLLPALLAAEAVGVFAPINPTLAAEHATQLVRLAGAGVIVAAGPELDARTWQLARRIAAETQARALIALRPTLADGPAPQLEPLEGTEVAYLEQLLPDGDVAELPVAPPATEDVASYLHTGGTTGAPKLAARTHANQVANAWMLSCVSTLEPHSTGFAALPLFHTNALVVSALTPLFLGGHVVWAGPLGYRDVPLFRNFWRIVERYSIAAMSGVPTIYATLAQVPLDGDISSLEVPGVGAAPLPRAVSEAFTARTGLPLCEGYGLTEGTCVSSRNWPQAVRAGTVGQRLPYQDACAVAVDEQSGEWTFLPPGEVGTLVLRGPNVFAGYLVRGPSGLELASDGKIRDGWLDTGDLGSVDEEGFIRLAGRAKDLIIRGGHNIDPATIEEAFLTHPAVTAAAAVGRPDVHAGEVPAVFVALAPDSVVTSEELVAWAAVNVPERAAAPKHVYIVEEIPLTAVGKPFKPELRRRAAEQAAREALAATTVGGQASAVLGDRGVEIHVPSSESDAEVREALDAFPWNWQLT
jgi:fatty-acyl-CoA synthase